jgi:putative ABC transport system permease protein
MCLKSSAVIANQKYVKSGMRAFHPWLKTLIYSKPTDMLKEHWKIALRNIARHKTYAFINMLGLSLGICSCLVIFLICHHELSTDRFHPGKDRIYRFVEVITRDGNTIKLASAPHDISRTARTSFTGLETIASYFLYDAKISIPHSAQPNTHYDNTIPGTRLPSTILAEPDYFKLFHYNWLAGAASTAPNTIILTETSARKFFGNSSPAALIGQQLLFNDSLTVTVTGIVQDWNQPTDMPFTEFLSYSTSQTPFVQKAIASADIDQGVNPFASRAFIQLQPGVSPDRLAGQLQQLSKLQKVKPGTRYALTLQPLTKIHFDETIWDGFPKPHRPTYYVLMGVAAFMLLLATINFVNLSTALSIRRSKEIGMRKVLGGSKRSITLQFLTETFVLTAAALLLALLAVKPILYAFQAYIPQLANDHLLDAANISFLVLLLIVTTLLAGFYPANVLSAYAPVLSLKGPGANKGQGKWGLRRSLIVFQFTISLIFIISTTIISRQVNYMRTGDLGFNTDAVVTLEDEPRDASPDVALVAQKIRQLPGVQKVALQSFDPLSPYQAGFGLTYKGKAEKQVDAAVQVADSNFISLYDIHMLAGRNLREGASRDSIKEFVVNESLTKALGLSDPAKAVGQLLYLGENAIPIVGVVADFHENSYRQPIRPVAILDLRRAERCFAVKLAAKGKNLASVKTTLNQMEQIWKGVYPNLPFKYNFLDESIAAMYSNEQKTATLMNVATAVSIAISCMGLFGLSLFTAGQRKKEISIRKVLGASVSGITSLLTRDFLALITLSLIVASPIAWYITHRWLQDFLYRAPINIWIFLLSGGLALALGLLTIIFQAIRAATANPVDSLRAE